MAALDTHSNGFFYQQRIGRYGKPFTIVKLKTFHPITNTVSKTGRFLRKYKLDELPQLFNILVGEMSFVGPRPDIAGYYDILQNEDRLILQLKPGITSEAAIKYRNEEYFLDGLPNPKDYYDEVIFPDKIKMNLRYYHTRTFIGDIKIIIKTFYFFKPQ